VELGTLDPEAVITPGIFVKKVVHIPHPDGRIQTGGRKQEVPMVNSEQNHRLGHETSGPKSSLDIPDGAYVNLGIGIPEMVAAFVPEGREFIYHTENGLLGMGPTPDEGQQDPELINAGKKCVTAIPGACYFHHADSFTMIRGKHIDVCVLGALQIPKKATWPIGPPANRVPYRP
jgi:acyl CoA:acetate/3-ketoacid CoA transferase